MTSSTRKEDKHMRAFLEEYGIAVFVISVIALLILMGSSVGTKIQTALESVIDSFKTKADGFLTT